MAPKKGRGQLTPTASCTRTADPGKREDIVRALGEDQISQGQEKEELRSRWVETHDSNGVTGSTVLLVNRMEKDVGCWSLLIGSAQETKWLVCYAFLERVGVEKQLGKERWRDRKRKSTLHYHTVRQLRPKRPAQDLLHIDGIDITNVLAL